MIKIYQLKMQYVLKSSLGIEINLARYQQLYEFIGPTYGCCTPDEIAVSEKPYEGPFYGVPKDLLQEIGEHADANRNRWAGRCR
jgi:hypothetical protein